MTGNNIPVLRLTQWLDIWNEYEFNEEEKRRKPEPHFYLFSMSATRLRHYSDVYRRERNTENVEGLQRAREESRTTRIKKFIKAGYPYGDLKESQCEENKHLRKPGWLPTAIVINILTQEDERRKKKIKPEHLVKLQENNSKFSIHLPNKDLFIEGDLRPFEVIDGQHRLWAFDEDYEYPDFEVPVVAFHGLDVGWQAYLFWSINISPVRINPSHAFDLYPLLRSQDWLEYKSEIKVYREARAQEITEWLYRHPHSSWNNRISMLQRKGERGVSQAAWVRSLVSTFFAMGRGSGRRGLFQNKSKGLILEWERVQQIAFIMEFWNLVKEHVNDGTSTWIDSYKKKKLNPFTDNSSMLNQDMGIRAIHAVLNDLFFAFDTFFKLSDWYFGVDDKTVTTEQDIVAALKSLKSTEFYEILDDLALAISKFDWRSVNGPG
ncbi:MAG: DGQHR domain-containing protein [Gammaproteobacteria bacterium]|nr:DGQHR domain-containing protein [Gammaproteobacteria bacterium]MDE2739104.1 DGQHR domain-containing protein [Paracoccaceae bacterium]